MTLCMFDSMSLAAAHLWHKPSERAAWMRRFVIVSDSAIRIYGTRTDHEQRNDPMYYIELLTTTDLLNGSDNIIMQGWLIKKGKIKWNSRWCALVKYGYINYIDPEQKQGIRSIDLNHCRFELETNHNTIQWKSDRGEWFQFRCDSPSLQRKWHNEMLNVQKNCMKIRRENETKRSLNKEPTLFAFTVRKMRGNQDENDINNIKSNRFEQHYFCADTQRYLEGWKKCITEQIAHCTEPKLRSRQQSIYLRTQLYQEEEEQKETRKQSLTARLSTMTLATLSPMTPEENKVDYWSLPDIDIDTRMQELMNSLKIPKHARNKMLSLNNKQKIAMLQQHDIKQRHKQKECGMRWSDKFASYNHNDKYKHHVAISTLQQFSVVLRDETDDFIVQFIENLGLNHLCALAVKYSSKYSQFDMELIRVFKAMIDSLYGLSAMVSHSVTIRIIVGLIDSTDIKISELAVSLLVTMVGFEDDQISIAASKKILTSLIDLALHKGQRNKYKVLLDHMSVKDVLNGSFQYDVFSVTLINYLIMTLDEIHLRMEERRLLNALNFDKILNKLQDRYRGKCEYNKYNESFKSMKYNDALINQIKAYRALYEKDRRNVDAIMDGWDMCDFDLDNPRHLFERVHDQCLSDGYINELAAILKNLVILPSTADNVWYNLSRVVSAACKPIQNEILYGKTVKTLHKNTPKVVKSSVVVGGCINTNSFDDNYVKKELEKSKERERSRSIYPSYRELKRMLDIRESMFKSSDTHPLQTELDAAREKQLKLENALLAEKSKSHNLENQLNHLFKYGTIKLHHTHAQNSSINSLHSPDPQSPHSSSSFVVIENENEKEKVGENKEETKPKEVKAKAKKEIKLVIVGAPPDDKLNKYRKMIKFKMPKQSIMNKMRQDGVDADIIDEYESNDRLPGGNIKKDPNPKSALLAMIAAKSGGTTTTATSAIATTANDAKLTKYKKMLKMHIPKQSVINKMRQDHISSSLIAILFPDAIEAKEKTKNGKTRTNILNGVKAKTEIKLPPGLKPKKVIKPRNKMRNLHWTTVNPFAVEKTMWKQINEVHSEIKLDTSALENKFCWKQIDNKRKKEKEKIKVKRHKKEIVRVLDTRRAYNIEIFLGRLKMNPWSLREAMLSLNENKLSLDTIHKLINFVPTTEESQCLNGYESEKHLGVAENFVKIIRNVDDNLIQRLQLWEFKIEFESLYCAEMEKLNWLNTANNAVLASDSLKLMFAVILSIGNYMNGSTSKGCCYGFKLNSLSQLIRSRTTDNRHSLMQFIYEFCCNTDEYKDALHFTKDLQCLDDATTVDIAVLRQNIAVIRNKLNQIKKRINQNSKPSEILRMGDNFLNVFAPFYEESINKYNALETKRDLIFNKLRHLAVYCNEAKDSNFKFLKTLNEFRINFLNQTKIYKIEKQKMEQIEKRKQNKQNKKKKQNQQKNNKNISDVVIQTLVTGSSDNLIQRLQDRNKKCIKT